MRLPSRLLCLVLGVALAPAARAQEPETVRVRLFGTTAPAHVTVTGPAAVSVDGRAAGRIASGASARVEASGGSVRVSGVDGAGQQVEIVPDAGQLHIVGGRAQVDVEGRIAASVVGSALVVVNHVPMPAYVASVVASEYGFPEIEGVKAQAVLVRTYAARAAAEPRAARRPYDVDDHQGSQVYRGAGVVTPVSERGERETRGQILTYNGAPVEAVYSSSSGGHTADNESVWLTPAVPYLRGVADPYEADAPDHMWRTTADAARVHAALSRRFGGSVTAVAVAERSREGRAVRMRLVGARTETVSGSDFRTAVNGSLGWRTVRSTRVEVSVVGGQYVFDGRGFGHGVGLSQYGARGQARAGRSYLDILAFYFRGTQVRGAATYAASGWPAAAPRAASSEALPAPVSPAPAPVTAAPAAPPRGRGEAFVVRNPPAATPTAAPPTAIPAVRTPAAPPDGRRWPTPRTPARSGW